MRIYCLQIIIKQYFTSATAMIEINIFWPVPWFYWSVSWEYFSVFTNVLLLFTLLQMPYVNLSSTESSERSMLPDEALRAKFLTSPGSSILNKI